MSNVEHQTHNDELDKNVVYEKAPDFVSFYCNNVLFGMSFMDIAFFLGELLGADEKGITHVQNRARVVMSPQQLKIFSGMTQKIVAAYESRFGEINIPPDLQIAVQRDISTHG